VRATTQAQRQSGCRYIIAVSPDGKTMKFAITDKLHNTTANWMAEKQ